MICTKEGNVHFQRLIFLGMVFLCVTFHTTSTADQYPMTYSQLTNDRKTVLNTFTGIYYNRTKKFSFGNKTKAVKSSAFGNFSPASFWEK